MLDFQMELVFKIEYFTRWGENLVLRRGERAFAMHYVPDGIWTVSIPSEEFFAGDTEAQYWYEVTCGGLSMRHEWRLHRLKASSAQQEINDSWSDVPGWKGAGTAVPVFSLRGPLDLGVGGFTDLVELVDWASATGQCFIQLLPVNDTTASRDWQDSYPYSAISSFALNPLYMDIPAMGVEADADYMALHEQLESLPKIDYSRVFEAKERYMRRRFVESWPSVSRRASYRRFFEENRDWLLPYAAFCALRDETGTADFSRWGDMAVYEDEKVERWIAGHRRECDYHCFLQYHLDMQLSQVRRHAHENGVFLKGDLPIGISRTSADAWQFPRLFNMDSQAGAPPDYFSADGQNWGFPTYNWEAMASDGYSWWKRRLRRMSAYFDAFRIDHILGFFRIWEIPLPQRSGILGHFNPALPYTCDEITAMGMGGCMDAFLEDPRRKGFFHPRIDSRERLGSLYDEFFHHRHNDFWKGAAIEKLSALLGATPMLACGEDLGMIPACVPEVMQAMNILSLEIQSMPKDSSRRFADPAAYPYASVCTTSTHDMNPLRAWWLEDRETTESFWHEALGRPGDAPGECGCDTAAEILRRHLESPSMLAIFPVQDWLALSPALRSADPCAERINVPSICPYNWCWRMHISIADMLGDGVFCAEVSRLVEDSGR